MELSDCAMDARQARERWPAYSRGWCANGLRTDREVDAALKHGHVTTRHDGWYAHAPGHTVNGEARRSGAYICRSQLSFTIRDRAMGVLPLSTACRSLYTT